MPPATRKERDLLGEMDVPAEAYYGAQTQRAALSLPISGERPRPELVRAMAQIKRAAARANLEAGRLEPEVAAAMDAAAEDVIEGRLDNEIVVDVFQAGAGLHVNVNEVIANRASETLGLRRGDYTRVHPDNHVSLGQSCNDVAPTAMRLAALALLRPLLEALNDAASAFRRKAREYAGVVKAGRAHLRDDAPVTLGQEFGAYAEALEKSVVAIERSADDLRSLGFGGGEVGTGRTCHAGFRQRVAQELCRLTGEHLRCSADTFEAMQSMAPFVRVSGEVRALAVELIRICNDLRLLSSGPNAGLAEISLPAAHPVVCECVNMICFHAIGADATVTLAAQAGQLEMNAMAPVIAAALLKTLAVMGAGLRALADHCVRDIEADAGRLRRYADSSPGLAALLETRVGEGQAADVAREALAEGAPTGELAVRKGLLTREELDRLLLAETLPPDKPVT